MRRTYGPTANISSIPSSVTHEPERAKCAIAEDVMLKFESLLSVLEAFMIEGLGST